MMTAQSLIIALIAIPLLGVLFGLLPVSDKTHFRITTFVAGLECIVTFYVMAIQPVSHRIFALGNNLFLDTLSIFHIALVAVVFFLSSLYCHSYFFNSEKDTKAVHVNTQRFIMLWNGFFAILIAALCSNNMGMLWICIEASTLISALLIMTDGKGASIEAMWKYLLLCSVGIAFAFIGTLLLSVAAQKASFAPSDSLLWTSLIEKAGMLNGGIMLASFIFVLIGFGTKAGLAPMHTWLPDAHSQAPTPVSAVFSGVMLNCALYAIMRYLPLTEASVGWTGKPHALLLLFGLISIIAATVFIPSQKNIKRLLAYCSVEHIGIIALGIGIGGIGTFAALFHTINHSLSKVLAFYSAGQLSKQYNSYEIAKIKGACSANTLYGTGLFIGILALFGAAPFSIFMSELLLIKAALAANKIPALVIFLVCTIIVFVSASGKAISMCFGPQNPGLPKAQRSSRDIVLVATLVVLMILCGLWMPSWLFHGIKQAASIVDGYPLLEQLKIGMIP